MEETKTGSLPSATAALIESWSEHLLVAAKGADSSPGLAIMQIITLLQRQVLPKAQKKLVVVNSIQAAAAKSPEFAPYQDLVETMVDILIATAKDVAHREALPGSSQAADDNDATLILQLHTTIEELKGMAAMQGSLPDMVVLLYKRLRKWRPLQNGSIDAQGALAKVLGALEASSLSDAMTPPQYQRLLANVRLYGELVLGLQLRAVGRGLVDDLVSSITYTISHATTQAQAFKQSLQDLMTNTVAQGQAIASQVPQEIARCKKLCCAAWKRSTQQFQQAMVQSMAPRVATVTTATNDMFTNLAPAAATTIQVPTTTTTIV